MKTLTAHAESKFENGLSQRSIAIVLVFGLLLLGVSLFQGYTFIIAGIAAIAAVALFTFPKIGLALLVPALFLEADSFSIQLPFGRFRIYHFIILVLFTRALWEVISKKASFRKTALDIPIVVYLAINAATIYLAPDKLIAIKITGLLVFLALLYWTVAHFIRTREAFFNQLKLLGTSTVVVALFGLFQVFAVWLMQNHDIFLWSGQVIHSDVIPFGRPYATFVEPDWYGTYMLAALVVTALLALNRAHRAHQVEYILLSVLFAVSLVLSAVRGAWLAALLIVPITYLIDRRLKTGLQWSFVRPVLLAIAGLLLLLFLVAPEIPHALYDRVATLFDPRLFAKEPRFLVMQDGWNIFLSSPWFGYGPGAYTTLGTLPFVKPMLALIHGIQNFQTNALITVLVDTGITGLIAGSWLVVRLVKSIQKGLKNSLNDPILRTVLFALSMALFSLGIAYQASTGLWLGLTWYLVSLIISGSLLSDEKPQKTR
jgi:O-antigen ligase